MVRDLERRSSYRVVALGLLVLQACSGPETPSASAPGGGLRSLAALRADPPRDGATVDVGPLVAVSRVDRAGRALVAQDEGGDAGTLVSVGGRIDPAFGIGERFAVRATWRGGELEAASLGNFARPGDRVPLTVVEARPDALPLPYTLARWDEVVVTSLADPTGRADTSLGLPLVARFGHAPPMVDSRGSLEAVVLPEPALAMVRAGAFSGPQPPLSLTTTTVASLRAGEVAEGRPVSVEAVQVTPWSRDGRYVLLAEADGSPGVWLDVEGFGVGTGSYGERGVWFGEVRHDGDVVYLRSWVPRTRLHTVALAAAQVDGDPPDGAIVTWTLSELGAADRFGRVPLAGGWRLDGRLRSLDGLAQGDTITAAVWRRGEDRRLLPLPHLEPPMPDDTDAPFDSDAPVDTDGPLDTDLLENGSFDTDPT